jgi:hypothetical protein
MVFSHHYFGNFNGGRMRPKRRFVEDLTLEIKKIG